MKKRVKILSLMCCLIFSFIILPSLTQAAAPSRFDIEARAISDSRLDINALLNLDNLKRNSVQESLIKTNLVDYLVKGVTGLGDYGRSIVFFVTYGTPSTKHLGDRERSGVLNSYKAAYNRLPLSTGDWTDVLRIANGQPPVAKSIQAETNARLQFRKTFDREPILSGDSAAILMIAYGVRPAVIDKKLERAALAKFKTIYGFLPLYGYQWDILRAITYGDIK